MIAMTISDTIKPYSMAVAPELSRDSLRSIFNMTTRPLFASAVRLMCPRDVNNSFKRAVRVEGFPTAANGARAADPPVPARRSLNLRGFLPRRDALRATLPGVMQIDSAAPHPRYRRTAATIARQ